MAFLRIAITRQCGGSEVRIILAASPRCGLLNQSHTRFNELLVPFDSEVRKTSVPQNDANFGIGALAYCWSMMFSDLPSPAEASSQMTDRATGFAQAGNRDPLFGIMLYPSRWRRGTASHPSPP